ncbi:MAG: DUF4926 domain-containing protein [Myxococcaceae bacterium]|nr:DUF4926 domain-containing protein [Myxococcaceae bacterium]MCI0673507.1 DUF4926 domain-containing protein [Myxococcaceae bacterium]
MSGFPLLSVVRTRVPLKDTDGRPVPAATQGAVEFVHEAPFGDLPAYEVEVVREDGQTAHVLTARHSELELALHPSGINMPDLS